MLLLHGGQISEIGGVRDGTGKSPQLGFLGPELQLENGEESGLKFGKEESKLQNNEADS